MEKNIITLEEYEAEMRAHLPMATEEGIKSSISFMRECIELAQETGEMQEPIDLQTLEPFIRIYPGGGIEFVRHRLD